MAQTFSVNSRDRWFATPVWVQAGEVLTFRASGTWWDAVIPCSADGYAAPLFYAAGLFPRIPDDGRYFRLMGRVAAGDTAPTADDPAATFAIGTNLSRTFSTSGCLFVFANDRDGFYWNNWGRISLTVDRAAP